MRREHETTVQLKTLDNEFAAAADVSDQLAFQSNVC